MNLLIAIPIYNEEKYVDRVLSQILSYHDQVLVIDDGSSDGTAEILRKRKDVEVLRHSVNHGYGCSLIDAFAYADRHGYDWVLTMDCDEQHEPARIPDFIREIETDEWDLISGSRYKVQRSDNDLPPGDRRVINVTITEIINDVLGLELTDSFCGFKAHRISAMRKLRLDERGYAFPMQLWPQVVRAGLRINEIPVRLIYNDPTRHFGGILDNPDARLGHYLEALQRELMRRPEELTAEDVVCSCSES